MFSNLQKQTILNELPADKVREIGSLAYEKNILAGDAIIWQGDACQSIYCVLSGEVEIYRLSPAGREQIMDRMTAGTWFNLVPALVMNGKNQANARALTECRLLVISKSDFLWMMSKIPELSMAVSKYFAHRLVHMTDLVETLSLYPVRQRLARFLIDQADRGGESGAVHWTQSDIANRLGTVRDVLGRTLRKMADEGMLRIEREKILLLDREKLERAATGEE